MNERIKELYNQSQVDGYFGKAFSPDKFAQLIVEHATECVRTVLRDENSDLSYDGCNQVQAEIKRFFGFKE